MGLFDAFEALSAAPGFSGSPAINAVVEVGKEIPRVVHTARQLKDVVTSYLAELAGWAGITRSMDYARVLIVLFDGAMVAAQRGDHGAWMDAKTAAEKLIPLYC